MAAKIKIRKLSFTLIFIVLVLMISFIAFCNYGFSFSPEELAVLNKAQKSLDSHKLQENASQTFSTKKTDSHFSIGYKEYENTTYGVDVMYPKGWKWTYQDPDYYESNPETIFIILFVSPTKGDVNFAGITIKIENLESAMMTSEQYRDQTVTYLKGSYPDIKEVSVSKTTLAGKPAYQIESMQRFLDYWKKDVSIFTVKDGKVYTVSVLAKPEEMTSYSQDIKNMINSVQFEDLK